MLGAEQQSSSGRGRGDVFICQQASSAFIARTGAGHVILAPTRWRRWPQSRMSRAVRHQVLRAVFVNMIITITCLINHIRQTKSVIIIRRGTVAASLINYPLTGLNTVRPQSRDTVRPQSLARQ